MIDGGTSADRDIAAAAPELARTVVALHERVAAVEAERDALRKRVADVEYDLNREVEARNAAGAELDAVLAHAEELTQALRETQRERDAMKAIIEGRTTPPTDGEALDIFECGGSFRMVCNGESYDCSTLSSVWAVSDLPNTAWWAFDAHGRPCAWPGGGQ